MLQLLLFLVSLPALINSTVTSRLKSDNSMYEESKRQQEFILSVENSTFHVQDGDAFNVTVHMTSTWKTTESVEVKWDCSSKFVYPKEDNMKSMIFSQNIDTKTIELETNLYGIYYIRFYRIDNQKKIFFNEEPEIEVFIKRQDVAANNYFILVITILLSIALVLMGLELDLQIVWNTIKRPIGPAIGMVCQFGFMPVTAYVLGWLFLTTTYERLGLLLLGSSPGGANSNFWTAMFNGDVNLSCTMTFLSSLGSFLFTTMWVYFLGSPMVGKDVPIPYIKLVISLVSFTFPLLVGIGIKYKWTKLAEKLKRASRPFFLLCLIFMPSMGLYQNRHFFYLCSWRHVTAGAGLGFVGYFLGALLAFICRQTRPQIIAISLETAFQNGGISFIILNLTFESPISDMANIPMIGFFFCSTGPCMFVFYSIYLAVKKIIDWKKFQSVPQDETIYSK